MEIIPYDNIKQNKPALVNVLDDYLAGQLTDGTRNIYERDITQIFGGKVPTWEDIRALTTEQIVAWRNESWDAGKGLAATTINRKLTAIKTFYDHLIARRLIRHNPAHPKLVHRIKVKRSAGARLGITIEELASLLAACDHGKNKKINIRDRTIISLMYSCLLRRSEVSEILWKDLEREGGRTILNLPLTKGGANDFVPISPEMIVKLDQYFVAMGGAATWLSFYNKPIFECPVFLALDPAHRGDKLSSHGVNEIVKKRAKIAGIQTISAHILRHTAITHLLADGEPIVDVQILARHTDPKQTSQYAMLLRRINNATGRSLALRI